MRPIDEEQRHAAPRSRLEISEAISTSIISTDADKFSEVVEPLQRRDLLAEQPEIKEIIRSSVRPRHVSTQATSGAVIPKSIDQLVGVSIDEPPTPDPQNPPPVYPAEAQREQRQGRVVLTVRIALSVTLYRPRLRQRAVISILITWHSMQS